MEYNSRTTEGNTAGNGEERSLDRGYNRGDRRGDAGARGAFSGAAAGNGAGTSAVADRGYRPRAGVGGGNFSGGNWKRQNFYKKKDCPVESGVVSVDYKDSRTLQKFTSERGKVFPRRISSVSAKGQRKLAVAIKRARFLALLPYVAD